MNEINQYLSQSLKVIRKQKGWSLDQTVKETGVSKAMLGQIEHGVTEHIMMIISGSMELLINDKWISLAHGVAIRFAADQPHGYRNLTEKPAVFHDLIHYKRASGLHF